MKYAIIYVKIVWIKFKGTYEMKNLEKYLLHASAYTVIITFAFFLFANISGVAEPTVSPLRLIIISVFSLVISFCEGIFSIKGLHKALAYAIHYTVLFITFLIIYMMISESDKNDFTFILAALVIFSVIYLVFVGISLVFKKIAAAASKNNVKNEKPVYRNRF